MRRYTLLIFILCFIQSTSSKIYFRHLGASDGLSQSSVMSIAQDELGRMWFGTMEGLNCYNGDHIVSYRPSAEYPFLGNQIFNIVSDRQGSLFFTSDGMLVRYDIYADKFIDLNRKDVTTLFARKGNVWMASSDSVFMWKSERQEFDFVYAHSCLPAIKTLSVDCDGRLWIGTQNGLYRTEDYRQVPQCIISNGSICSLYQDSQKNMWVAMVKNGAYRIPWIEGVPERFEVGREALSDKDVRSFIEDGQGNMWIATFNGLNKLDKQGHFSYYKEDVLPGSLQHSSIFSLYKDMQGTIWLGTYYGGVHYFNPDTDSFVHYAQGVNRDDCLSSSFIGKMVEDKQGDVWIVTGGGGLNRLNRKTGKLTHYLSDGTSHTIPFNSLMCIEYDKVHNRLYVGTYSKGLFSIDISSERINHFRDFANYGSSLIHLEMHGTLLYMLTTKGMFTMDTNTGEIRRTLNLKEFMIQGATFTVDSRNHLWMAQANQLLCVDLNNPWDIRRFTNGKNGLGRFPISRIVEDRKGDIYLGTVGSGLFRYDKKNDTFINYTAEDGCLQSNYCYDIALYEDDYLIVSGEKGISVLNPQKKIVKTVGLENKLFLSALNEGCGILVCRDDHIFVSGVDGMTSFVGNKLFKSFPPYNLYFSSLFVNNQSVPIDTSGILQTALPFTSRVDLNYNQNNIAVTFASNNYIPNLQRQNYEYKLEGFDKDWITAVDKKIVYTNLSPGHYVLMLREQQKYFTQLQIVIHSPWYATWIAYLSYVFFVSFIVYILIRNRQTKMRLQYSLEVEKMKKEKNEEITQAKLQFFSNISHEFRTPLTLIMSQLEMLLQHKGHSPFVYTRLLKIHKNTFQLRELISELLNFRKLEQEGIQLKVSRMDLIPFLQSVYADFQELAFSRNIHLSFLAQTEAVECWFDAKQLQKVFSNLLSNAFKYTDDGGQIDIIIEKKEGNVEVKVMDTGQGIKEEDINRIFDRFYQADNSILKEPGTGIGLALAKGLVELHHGNIAVRSVWEYGSIFIVTLPLDNVFSNDKNVVLIDVEEQLQRIQPFTVHQLEKVKETLPKELPEESDVAFDESGTIRILIVEDNEELLHILSDLLSPFYKVSIALNGKDGLEKAMDEQPDLILSDIMMPVMSGTEMCMKIKDSFELCHIPVVLLTALTDEDKELKGLEYGADDYISKPFSNKILLKRIASILRNRNLLRKKYSCLSDKKDKDNEIREIGLTAIDKRFLNQLEIVIGEHLLNPEFSINMLAKEMKISRASFYNKIKALCNMTPGEFISTVKLNRAAEMLKNQPELQITEIAYQLGFSSLRYFRYCFKAQFNKTPQEYRKS